MTPRLSDYSTLVFDCDGVVLDSNRIKTDAFRIAALPWGEAAAEALVAHHVVNGGVSRYAKFAYFLEYIVPDHAPRATLGLDGPDLETLLRSYAEAVRSGLMACNVAEGLSELRAATPNARWLIVSGGDQTELREIFAARGFDAHFDGGIFGSPDTKHHILARELDAGTIRTPALFLGDSRLDHEAAARAGLDFVFIHGWTEMSDWVAFTDHEELPNTRYLSELIQPRDPVEKLGLTNNS